MFDKEGEEPKGPRDPRSVLLASLEGIEISEKASDGGQVEYLCVVYSVRNKNGKTSAIGFEATGHPAFAIIGLLNQAAKLIEESHIYDEDEEEE